MMTIYSYGCTTCGVNAIYIRNIVKYGQDHNVTVEVKNTKYDKVALTEHINYLIDNDLVGDTYQTIVVDNGTVTKVRDWR